MRDKGLNTVLMRNLIVMYAMLLMVISTEALAQCRYAVRLMPQVTRDGVALEFALAMGLGEDSSVIGWAYQLISDDEPWREGPSLGFLWDGALDLKILEAPDNATGLKMWGIYDRDVMVGNGSFQEAPYTVPYLFIDGQARQLAFPNSSWGNVWSVNRKRQAVGRWGFVNQSGVSGWRPMLWDERGFHELPLPTGTIGVAMDINDKGVVTGWYSANGEVNEEEQAAIWKKGRLRVLGQVPGGLRTVPSAINNHGVLVGQALASFPSQSKAFIWNQQGFVFLPTPPVENRSVAFDINDQGQVVGMVYTNNPITFLPPVLWQGGNVHGLNTLLREEDEESFIGGVKGINNRGDILVTANGWPALLIPVDSPVGDIDKNCLVNVTDLLMLLHEFGNKESYADVDEDGDVDVLDLIQLLQNYGNSSVP